MKLFVYPALAGLLVAGCGGGGGGSEAPAAAYNTDRAITTLLSTPVSFPGLTTRDAQGNAYTFGFSLTPAPDFQLNGATYHQTVQNVTLAVNGTSAPGERFPTQYLYQTTPTRLAAQIVASRNSGFSPIIYAITLLNGVVSLPVSAAVGAGGTYATTISYAPQLDRTSTATAQPAGNGQVLWSLEPDGASSAFLCLTLPVEKDCFRINPAGDVLGARVTVTVSGQTLTFK